MPDMESSAEHDVDLPKALIRKIVKQKLSSAVPEGKGDVNVAKDALLAFSESAKVFISFLTTAANDICKENKRQTISPEHVLQALDELDFVEFIEPLKQALEGYREASASKKLKAEASKKRKERPSSAEPAAASGAGGADEAQPDAEGAAAGDDTHAPVPDDIAAMMQDAEAPQPDVGQHGGTDEGDQAPSAKKVSHGVASDDHAGVAAVDAATLGSPNLQQGTEG